MSLGGVFALILCWRCTGSVEYGLTSLKGRSYGMVQTDTPLMTQMR